MFFDMSLQSESRVENLFADKALVLHIKLSVDPVLNKSDTIKNWTRMAMSKLCSQNIVNKYRYIVIV
jgi:hypothetical protein